MWLRWLIPWFPLRQLPATLAIAAVGALAAGLYGVIHDQVTYTISPEYFTRLKFEQFAWADLGWPRRVFVGQIGWLASWWVGLIGGWFFARAGAAELPPPLRWRAVLVSMAAVLYSAAMLGIAGWLWGRSVAHGPSLERWEFARELYGLADLKAFVVVAHIHNGSYLGAAFGSLVAAIAVWRVARRLRRKTGDAAP